MEASRYVSCVAVAAVLLVTCPLLTHAAASSRCPLPNLSSRYIQEHGEKCYQFVLSEETWADARSFCHSRGAALANANTYEKQQFLQNVLTRSDKLGNYFTRQGFWIGLHDRDTEDAFEWDRGPSRPEVPLGAYRNWNPGEPNNILGQDCVYMRRRYSWKWVDVDCHGGIRRHYSFACEYDLKPKTTTTATTKKLSTTTTTITTTQRTTSTSTTRKETTNPTFKTTDANGLFGPEKELEAVVLPAGNKDSSDNHKNRVAGFGKSQSHDTSDVAKTVALPVALILIIAALVFIIVFILVRRRRRKQFQFPVILNNPCYGNDGETGFSACRIQDNGNIYVDFAPDTDNLKNDKRLSFNNQDKNETSPMKISANPLYNGADGDMFLDEYGMYTSDGYLAPKHLYAEVPDIVPPAKICHIAPPPRKPMTNHYSKPSNNQALGQPDYNVYEDVRISAVETSLDSTPQADPVYEVPHSARADNFKSITNSVSVAAAEYDVPKSLIPTTKSE